MASKKSEDSELLDEFHLNEDDLTNEAKDQFPFYKEILESLTYGGHSALSNNRLSPAGRHIFCSELLRSFDNVKNVLHYLSTKPMETEKVSEVPMIIISGLPRTGTTLLHNLMACDPSCRAPFATDMFIRPIPPILRSNIDEHKRRAKTEADFRVKVFEDAQRDLKTFQNNLALVHPAVPVEQDTYLLRDAGAKFLNIILSPKETNYFDWFVNQQNKDFAYQYHQTILQMLHDTDPPRTHWQLKGAQHIFWLNTLLRYYPQASIIMTHRRVDQVLPSYYSYWLAATQIYFNQDDLPYLMIVLQDIIPKIIDVWIHCIIEHRTRQVSMKNTFDIKYEDLMKDPIGTVRRIYDYFDYLEWSDQFEEAMRAWLIDNPQGKQGRHSYSLSQFNLEEQMNKQLYKDYEQLFL